MYRAMTILIAAAGLSACSHIATMFAARPPCPDVTHAEAWVNQMPGPGKRERPLVVTLQLDTGTLWMLRQAAAETAPGMLGLDLEPGGAGHAGTAGFRSVSAGHPDRIEIYCRGALHHAIDDVMTVS